MFPELPDGDYPFIDERFPLSELAMIEVPRNLEKLLREQALANKVDIQRAVPVEITCQSADYPSATFLIYLPADDNRLHMLAPKKFRTGLA